MPACLQVPLNYSPTSSNGAEIISAKTTPGLIFSLILKTALFTWPDFCSGLAGHPSPPSPALCSHLQHWGLQESSVALGWRGQGLPSWDFTFMRAAIQGARMEKPAKLHGRTKGSKISHQKMVAVPGLKRGPLTPRGCRSHTSTSKHDAKGDSSGFPPHWGDHSQVHKFLCV